MMEFCSQIMNKDNHHEEHLFFFSYVCAKGCRIYKKFNNAQLRNIMVGGSTSIRLFRFENVL